MAYFSFFNSPAPQAPALLSPQEMTKLAAQIMTLMALAASAATHSVLKGFEFGLQVKTNIAAQPRTSEPDLLPFESSANLVLA